MYFIASQYTSRAAINTLAGNGNPYGAWMAVKLPGRVEEKGSHVERESIQG